MSCDQSDSPKSPLRSDPGFLVILTLVVAVTCWLIGMPFVPAIARSTMNRFHLRTGSFAAWSVQQPIPAMYNLANRYAVYSSGSPNVVDDEHDTHLIEAGFVNHFPARMITFADARFRLLRNREQRLYRLESTYRGEKLSTRVLVRPLDDCTQSIVRLDEEVY